MGGIDNLDDVVKESMLKSVQDVTPDKKDEKSEDDKKPVEPAEAKKKEEKAETKDEPKWDKDRQHADEVRAFNAKLESVSATNQQLVQQLKEAQAQLIEIEKDKALSELDNNKLTEESDYTEVTDRINQLERTLKQREIERKSVTEELDRQKQLNSELSQQQAVQTGQQMIDTMLDEFDKKYSPESRNAALEAANKEFWANPISSKDADGNFVVPPEARKAFVETQLEKFYLNDYAAKQKKEGKNGGPAPLPGGQPGGDNTDTGELPPADGTLTHDQAKARLLKQMEDW